MTDPDEGYEEAEPEEPAEGERQTDRTDWKAEARKWEQRAKDNGAAKKELAELKKAQTDATASEVEKAREAGKAEAHAEVLKDRALDRLETRAAKTFADPEDARALLASKVDTFIVDGAVDTDAIDKELAALLKRKPHLGVQGKRFEGSADGGARGGNQPQKLTATQVKEMYARGEYAAIEEARSKGLIDYESARKR